MNCWLTQQHQPAHHLIHSREIMRTDIATERGDERQNCRRESWNLLSSGGSAYLWQWGTPRARESQLQQTVVRTRWDEPELRLNWTALMVSAAQEARKGWALRNCVPRSMPDCKKRPKMSWPTFAGGNKTIWLRHVFGTNIINQLRMWEKQQMLTNNLNPPFSCHFNHNTFNLYLNMKTYF